MSGFLKLRALLTFKVLAFTALVVFGNCSKLSAADTVSLEQGNAHNTTRNVRESDRVATLQQFVHERINQYRASKNLPPLELNAAISQRAKTHSENMANGTISFGHNGFQQRIQSIESEIVYRRAAENVAYNFGYDNPGERAVRGWINSARHRQNILGDYNLTGIGITQNQQGEYYFTQIFILE